LLLSSRWRTIQARRQCAEEDALHIFAKFIAERQDTNKMQTFHLAA